jgi:hypothetical protein
MRDPLARLVSQYRHEIKMNRERRSLLQAIREPSEYLAFSYYAYQLRPYLDLFGQRAVYVDTLESLTAGPQLWLGRLLEWLGVDPSRLPPIAGQRLNASPEVMEIFQEGSLLVRTWRYLRPHRRIVEILPARVRRWYHSRLPRKVRHPDSEEFRAEVEQVRGLLQPLLSEWIRELSDLTGRSYGEWPSHAVGDPAGLAPAIARVWLPDEILQVQRKTIELYARAADHVTT